MTRKAITAALLTSAEEIAAEKESDQNSNFRQTLPPYLNEVKNWVTSVLKVYVVVVVLNSKHAEKQVILQRPIVNIDILTDFSCCSH